MMIKHIDKLEVKDFDRNKVDLFAKYEGKDLLLIFYNNSCIGCTGRAIPLAYDYQKDFPFMKVIGIHSNFGNDNPSEDDIRGIFTTNEIPFPIYIDEFHKLYTEVQAEGTPQWLFISKNGDIIKSIFGSQANAQNRLLYTFEGIEAEKKSKY